MDATREHPLPLEAGADRDRHSLRGSRARGSPGGMGESGTVAVTWRRLRWNRLWRTLHYCRRSYLKKIGPTSHFTQHVKSSADIVRIIGEHVRLKKAGGNYVGLCPFHQEKTPSFSVHATRQFYYCFGCGARGDVFRFVMEMEKLTFPEALRRVAQISGVPIPKEVSAVDPASPQARLR